MPINEVVQRDDLSRVANLVDFNEEVSNLVQIEDTSVELLNVVRTPEEKVIASEETLPEQVATARIKFEEVPLRCSPKKKEPYFKRTTRVKKR